MKKHLFIPIILLSMLCTSCSCDDEPLAKKFAKKTTTIALDALEGVAEAVDEKGDKIAEKVANATGTIAQGAGRSIARQLDEHAATVASIAGRTLVQGAEGLTDGAQNEFYDKLNTKNNLCEEVSLGFAGIMKTKAVVNAQFLISKSGTYSYSFEFCSDDCKTVTYKKDVEADANIADYHYVSVSFALNETEEALVRAAKCTEITVKLN